MALSTEVFVTITHMTCPTCGCVYGINEQTRQRALKDPNLWWYCTNGHHLHYGGPDEATKLRAELDQEKAAARSNLARAHAAEERVTREQNRTAAYKGQVTKIKRRIGNGVCPCCNRSFTNVERHIKSQHPDFTEHTETPS